MLTGLPPHYNQNRMKMYHDIVNAKEVYPDFVSTDAASLMKQLLTKNPDNRLGSREGIVELKRHPFFKNTDWSAILNKTQPAPIKVKIFQSNFDR